MNNKTGIEMAEVIPGFIDNYEIEDLIRCFIPRDLLILSASEDKYSRDVDNIYNSVKKFFNEEGAGNKIIHKRYKGGHSLNKERFNYIIDWILAKV